MQENQSLKSAKLFSPICPKPPFDAVKEPLGWNDYSIPRAFALV